MVSGIVKALKGTGSGYWIEKLKTIDENYKPEHKYAGTLVYPPRPDDGIP